MECNNCGNTDSFILIKKFRVYFKKGVAVDEEPQPEDEWQCDECDSMDIDIEGGRA